MGIAKKILNATTEPNTIATGGGLSSFLVPRRFNAPSAIAIMGGIGAFNMAKEGLKSHNRAKLGRVSYGDGLARMTDNFGSGVAKVAKRASYGNYNAFSDMTEEVVSSPGIVPKIEDYGANPAFISALYHMGGR